MLNFSASTRRQSVQVASGVVLALSATASTGASADVAAIVPTDAAPVAAPVVAPVPSPVEAPVAAQPMIESLAFRNVAAADLLDLLGRNFNLPIVVSGDVDSTIGSINLANKSPEEAIRAVVIAGQLHYKRTSDGTYIVSKNPVQDDVASATPAITTAPSAASPFGAPTPFGVSGLPSPVPGFGTPFGAPNFGMGSQTLGNAAPSASFDLPSLAGFDDAASRNRQHSIRIKNVKASTMAYWIDPVNNPLPIELRLSDANASKYGEQPLAKRGLPDESPLFQGGTGAVNFAPGAFSPSSNPYVASGNAGMISPEFRSNAQFGRGNNNNNRNNRTGGAGGGDGGVFDLPGDIERLIAVDPQNVLLVQGGTDEDIRRLQEIISILDRPLRQVEIETQFVTLSTNDSRAFGIDFSTGRNGITFDATGFVPSAPTSAGSIAIGLVRNNFQATLRALVTNNKAKVLTAPRVTAINNLTASIVSQTSQPIILATTQVVGTENPRGITGENLIFITTSIGLTVTPTINNDDTITVLLQPQLQTPIVFPGIRVPGVSSQSVFTVANVRDGDTIALGGLRTKNISNSVSKIPLLGDLPLVGQLFRNVNKIEAESELIIFVTARIVRRAGFDDPIVNS